MGRRGLGKGLDSIFGTRSEKKQILNEKEPGAQEEQAKDSTLYNMVHEQEQLNSQQDDSMIDSEKIGGQALSGAMSPENPNNEEMNGQIMMRLSRIQPNLNQPRKSFDEEELKELADSIKQYGVIQPLILKKQGPLYEIVAGERRFRAARIAGLKEVPVIIRDIDDRTAREIAIIENIQREDLNAVEEALAYQSLIDEYGLTQEEVAERVAKNRSTITNSLRILKLEPEILDYLREGKISQGHARALLGITEEDIRLEIAKKCASENLSVREIEALVKKKKTESAKKKKIDEANDEEIKKLRAIYNELEEKMKARLGTKVMIVPKNAGQGKVEIEYYSQDDLDRIYEMLNSLP